MAQRNISADEALLALQSGEVIEDYPNDLPFPSFLWRSQTPTRVLHIVVADNVADRQRFIITLYEPDVVRWLADLRTRRPT